MNKTEKLERLKAADPNTSLTEDNTHDELDAALAAAETGGVTDGTGPLAGEQSDAVASVADNAELEHSAGGKTTRDDTLDAGVPMLQGDASEPVGPEDAFGQGEKRGDYSQRTESGPHLVSVPNPRAGQPIYREDEDGNRQVVDFEPTAILVDQSAAALERGEVAGAKGGVTT